MIPRLPCPVALSTSRQTFRILKAFPLGPLSRIYKQSGGGGPRHAPSPGSSPLSSPPEVSSEGPRYMPPLGALGRTISPPFEGREQARLSLIKSLNFHSHFDQALSYSENRAPNPPGAKAPAPPPLHALRSLPSLRMPRGDPASLDLIRPERYGSPPSGSRPQSLDSRKLESRPISPTSAYPQHRGKTLNAQSRVGGEERAVGFPRSDEMIRVLSGEDQGHKAQKILRAREKDHRPPASLVKAPRHTRHAISTPGELEGKRTSRDLGLHGGQRFKTYDPASGAPGRLPRHVPSFSRAKGSLTETESVEFNFYDPTQDLEVVADESFDSPQEDKESSPLPQAVQTYPEEPLEQPLQSEAKRGTLIKIDEDVKEEKSPTPPPPVPSPSPPSFPSPPSSPPSPPNKSARKVKVSSPASAPEKSSSVPPKRQSRSIISRLKNWYSRTFSKPRDKNEKALPESPKKPKPSDLSPLQEKQEGQQDGLILAVEEVKPEDPVEAPMLEKVLISSPIPDNSTAKPGIATSPSPPQSKGQLSRTMSPQFHQAVATPLGSKNDDFPAHPVSAKEGEEREGSPFPDPWSHQASIADVLAQLLEANGHIDAIQGKTSPPPMSFIRRREEMEERNTLVDTQEVENVASPIRALQSRVSQRDDSLSPYPRQSVSPSRRPLLKLLPDYSNVHLPFVNETPREEDVETPFPGVHIFNVLDSSILSRKRDYSRLIRAQSRKVPKPEMPTRNFIKPPSKSRSKSVSPSSGGFQTASSKPMLKYTSAPSPPPAPPSVSPLTFSPYFRTEQRASSRSRPGLKKSLFRARKTKKESRQKSKGREYAERKATNPEGPYRSCLIQSPPLGRSPTLSPAPVFAKSYPRKSVKKDFFEFQDPPRKSPDSSSMSRGLNYRNSGDLNVSSLIALPSCSFGRSSPSPGWAGGKKEERGSLKTEGKNRQEPSLAEEDFKTQKDKKEIEGEYSAKGPPLWLLMSSEIDKAGGSSLDSTFPSLQHTFHSSKGAEFDRKAEIKSHEYSFTKAKVEWKDVSPRYFPAPQKKEDSFDRPFQRNRVGVSPPPPSSLIKPWKNESRERKLQSLADSPGSPLCFGSVPLDILERSGKGGGEISPVKSGRNAIGQPLFLDNTFDVLRKVPPREERKESLESSDPAREFSSIEKSRIRLSESSKGIPPKEGGERVHLFGLGFRNVETGRVGSPPPLHPRRSREKGGKVDKVLKARCKSPYRVLSPARKVEVPKGRRRKHSQPPPTFLWK